MSDEAQKTIFIGLTAAVLAALFVSLNNILTPQIYDHGGSPITLVVLRYLGLVGATGSWVALFSSTEKCTPHELRMCLVVGAIYACAAASLLTAISLLPVSLAILIFYIFPLVTLFLESVLDREVPNLITLGAMLVALLGLAIVLGVEPVVLNPWGIMFAVLAAVCASIGFIVSGRTLRAVKPVLMIYHSAKAGLVVALIFLLVEGQGLQVGSTLLFWSLLIGGVATFGTAYYLMFAGVRLIGATRTSVVMNLEPIFTALLSAFILLETLTLTQALGAVLVILSVVAAQWWGRTSVATPN